MGGGSRTRVPQVNTSALIRENEQMNRVNTSGPFGSQTYTTGPGGQRTLTTALSPEMQAVIGRAFTMAGQPSARYQAPAGFGDLLASYMSRVRTNTEGKK